MSMYGVNASVPKTLVRHLVHYYADTCEDQELKEVLYDVLDTPVSPELLPPKDGEIAQKTEDLVGPYELHDFFLYYLLRFSYEPSKIYRIARYAFEGEYDDVTIYKWLYTFCRRFFIQQFKRSCLICYIHQYLSSLSCLRIFIGYTMILRIMPDIFKMLFDRCPYRDFPQCCSELY